MNEYDSIAATTRAGEMVRNHETKRITKDKREIDVLLTISPLRDGAGTATAFSVTARDITQQKQTLLALGDREEQFRQLAENIREVFFVVTPNPPQVTYISPAYEQIWGRSREELLERADAWIESVHDEDRPRVIDYFLSTISGKQAESEYRVVRPDGSIRWIHARAFPVSDPAGNFIRVVGIAEDTTERRRVLDEVKAARTAAEAANRAKSEFLANVSHEIRTPMNAMIGMTDLALDTSLTSEQRDYLQTVQASADSLLHLINEILDFSQIEAGKLEISRVEFDLHDCVNATLKTLQYRAAEKNLKLVSDFDSAVPSEVLGDPHRLRQVLTNLVGNAIKFTDQGQVALRMTEVANAREETTVQFSVTDTGPGIAPEKQKAVFDPFVQADNSSTRQYGGTGLGLSIAAQLTNLMGGRIWLASQPGVGSTFSFTVPFGVARAPGQPCTQPDLNPLRQDENRLRILVVEDNPINAKLTSSMLQKQGHRPVLVTNGRDALAIAQRVSFDLVLMDVQMPEMDGMETTVAIRKLESGTKTHLPIVALTAEAIDGDRTRCLAAGMDAYLSKPFTIPQLSRIIEEISRARTFPAHSPDHQGAPIPSDTSSETLAHHPS